MAWTFLTTFALYIVTTCAITGLMMAGYWLNSLFFPELRQIMDPNVSNLCMAQKQKILESAPKSALWTVFFIHIIACCIACTAFSYYAPDPQNNQYLFLFQILIILQFQFGEYLNQKEIPHPDWYENYYLGYISWMLS